MTVREAARLFGCSVSTVYRWLRRGLLGRFEEKGLTVSKSGRRWKIEREEKPMGATEFHVDWRAVQYNAPSRQMPRSVPWVHGLIRDAKGPSPRIELAPKKQKNDDAPVHLILAHPDPAAAEVMGWDDTLDITVDGHKVSVVKSLGPCEGWCPPAPGQDMVWALVAEIDADHPLVRHAAAAAKGAQEAMTKAEDAFYTHAREWMDRNFPHPDFMNVVRSLMLSEWQHKDGYWPGDPMPDADTILNMARDRIRGE